jgi:hypothetical protein
VGFAEGQDAIAVDALIAVRQATHGDFLRYCGHLRSASRRCSSRPRAGSVRRSGKRSIRSPVKLACILAGDPAFADHWRDMAGYASGRDLPG